MKLLDIGTVTEKTGVAPSTLRYYEEIGLIASAGRHGLRRQFAPDVLLQLKLISWAKSAGFSLDEITGMFASDGQPDLPRDNLRRKADELDTLIRDLSALRDTVRHVADCSAPSHMECPKFRAIIEQAARDGGKQANHPRRTVSQSR